MMQRHSHHFPASDERFASQALQEQVSWTTCFGTLYECGVKFVKPEVYFVPRLITHRERDHDGATGG